ncbi:monovalent cation/H+ antiporter complex subunit F [Sanguibacter suarezii]|uniref:monovalent cation/H+ antiporter complex subunit F n=1 Tax=Sanguibacter suarezii TaxID=60921 RepID=UPI000A00750A|nr:MrpF/PhaF family protein [Sanguibacter suarezii]
MTVVAIVCAALLLGAAVLALIRAERGPSMLDRTVALDVFVTALVGGIVVEAALTGRTDTLPLLVVLSMVGFVGSVTIARFAAAEPKGEGRVRTAEEIAQEEAARAGKEIDHALVNGEPRDLHEPKYPRSLPENPEKGGDR